MASPTAPIVLYARQMEEIKRRMNVVGYFLYQGGNALYPLPTVESVALQIRKILEGIAFGSLIANRDAYEAVYTNFAKTWKADLLLKDLGRLNPHYYPAPIKPNPRKRPNGVVEHELLNDGFLTEEEFIQVYERCNGLLHAVNPYRSEPNAKDVESLLRDWHLKITRLLNTHEVHLIGQRSMWVINMQEDGDDRVHFYEFVVDESQG